MSPLQPHDSPPLTAGVMPGLEPAWPKVFGVISIVVGATGALMNACGGVMSFASGALLSWLASVLPKGGVRPGGAGGAGGADISVLTETMAVMRPWLVVQGALAVVCACVSVWLLVAGVALVRRRGSGVRLHRRWAWTRVALVVVGAALTVVSAVATAEDLARIESAHGIGSSAGVKVAMGIGQGLLVLAWGLAYPVVVLVYMGRPKVKDHAAGWPD